MQFDQNKFYNIVMEKTNQKLFQASNQITVLEAQLQLALERNKELEEQIRSLTPQDTPTA